MKQKLIHKNIQEINYKGMPENELRKIFRLSLTSQSSSGNIGKKGLRR